MQFKRTVKLIDFTSFLKCFCVIFVFAFMCVCERVLCALCHSFKVSRERRLLPFSPVPL